VLLAAAETNLILNDLIGGRGSKTEHLDRAEQILDELIIFDPTNTKALFVLAALRETKEERVDLLRRVVAVDPTFILGWESLALAVSIGGAKEDLHESAELLEQAYIASPPGGQKRRLASDAIMQYENAQSSIDAERLRNRAQMDFRLDALMVVVAKPEAAGPERVNATLDELCSPTGVVIFGAKNCLEGIQSVVDAANAQTAQSRALSAQSATAAMWTAAQSGWRLDSIDATWRTRFEMAIDGFLRSQSTTPDMYAAYAAITPDRERRARAMEAAVARFPSNGDMLMRLGLAYLDQGRDQEAVAALTRAKELLPPTKHVMIDQALRSAPAR
jgi:tetratricopeptide (TPR) repeat protein